MNIINTSKKPRIHSRPKYRIHWVKGAELKTKRNRQIHYFNEIIAENFPNLEKQADIQMQTATPEKNFSMRHHKYKNIYKLRKFNSVRGKMPTHTKRQKYQINLRSSIRR